MEEELFCGACNMVFRSTGLLEKHAARFCIGGRVSSRGGGGGRGMVDPKQTRSPDLAQMKGPKVNGVVVRRRSVDVEPKSVRTEDEAGSCHTESASLQSLIDEFHRLRTSIEENQPNWSMRSTHTQASGRHLGQSETLREMKEMATLHERQLALMHVHNQQLEQQRDELAQQVSFLSEKNNTTHLEHLLMELREQEEKNEETLQQLSEHLHTLHAQKVSVPADWPDPAHEKKMHHDNYEFVSCVDDPLSAQIKSLRQAYVRSGGSDPVILAQMMELQAEAQSLEKNQAAASTKAKMTKVKPRQQRLTLELLVLEQENQRLEEEILRLRVARERNYNYEAAVRRTELELIQRETLQQVSSLQAEMERSKEAPRPWRQNPPPPPPAGPLPLQTTKPHIHAPLSLLEARSFSSLSGPAMMDPLDALCPSPYDPEAGFVVFFDLVLGLDASQKVLRLVAALYSEGLQVGPPHPHPPVRCLPGVSLPYSPSLTPGNCALLSVKQPAARIQPSPSLRLLVEVQAAGDLDVYNQEVFRLTSCGWTQLELFDHYNQLLSGHWRAPVRQLPMKPSLSIAQLNSIPQVGNMELCIRLANGRDADVQTLTKPDPTSTGLYKYQAVVSSPPVTVDRNTALQVSAPRATGGGHLSSPLPDPPPTDEARQS